MNYSISLLVAVFWLLLISCRSDPNAIAKTSSEISIFKRISPAQSNVDFVNAIEEGLNTNVLMYEYFYNGGGVAIGDVDHNGYEDFFFTSNMGKNKLYLNQGNMVFKEVGEKAGVVGRLGPWTTGVSMADINGDGWLDIYVCNSGNVPEEKKKNQLFMHTGQLLDGIPIFEEEGSAYGLDIASTSTQGSFFDYDRDGDLDLFLLNHNPHTLPVLDEASTKDILTRRDPAGSQLFRNDDGFFVDVSQEAGIKNSSLSYGLGLGISDVNDDGYLDVYVCNDYTVPDYLYINNGRGGFEDQLGEYLGHTSHFSMGNDIADINNDGYPEIFTLDMLPEDHERQNLLMMPDNYEKFDFNLRMGFHHQYMRNMLHVNNGNQTFSEVGQYANISNTDWSWSALFADFDRDGWKDLYVTNGYLRDYTNLDFLKYMSDYILHNEGQIQRQNVLDLVHKIPASNLENYFFRNEKNFTFNKVVNYVDDVQPTNSNGAAYADLDNDGDLDLVVNNINQVATILENQSAGDDGYHYLKLRLTMDGGNTHAIGSRATVYTGSEIQTAEVMPVRGFQSSVTYTLYFGLGDADRIDSLLIEWPNGGREIWRDQEVDQLLSLHYDANDDEKSMEDEHRGMAKSIWTKNGEKGITGRRGGQREEVSSYFVEMPKLLSFSEPKTKINDFKRQPLLPNSLSFNSPCMAEGDVNGDGLSDVFVGGKHGQMATLLLQMPDGSFTKRGIFDFELHRDREDVDAVFIDVDDDGDLDLYVASGGYFQYKAEDERLQDRLYVNDGEGGFTFVDQALPQMLTSSACVSPADIDGDGDVDLFIGGRVIPGQYPVSPRSYILRNDGEGTFIDVTAELQKELLHLGMVTDAEWLDVNGDKVVDLMVVGEWMPIHVFVNVNGRLENHSNQYFKNSYSGWWNTLLVEDINGDGRVDVLVGNQGENTQIVPGPNSPIGMVYNDFDDNGSIDPILTKMVEGKEYPYVTRDELLDQITMMRSRFTSYASYANASLTEVFSEKEMEGGQRLEAHSFKTMAFLRSADGGYEELELPVEVQFSPIYAILPVDVEADGKTDLLFFGNAENARLRFGKYDANMGLLVRQFNGNQWQAVSQLESGFQIRGDVRSALLINNELLIGHHSDGILLFQLQGRQGEE
ncbi:VCBS repeat-containing protein [Membranihabitans marinus]|uniref:VCBS repeat-containing protein n=1 Tax=Membranihabitans marinus TaxID=1227546 RepID=UPI001F45B895|nr:VCBS repeat-containing protein [Membranihabitans marinus]